MNNDNNGFESIDLESIMSRFRNSSKKTTESGGDTDWDSIFSKIKKYGIWILAVIILFTLVGTGAKIFYKVTQLNEMGDYAKVFYTNLFYMVCTAAACGLLTFIGVLVSNIFAKHGIKKIMKAQSFIDVEGKAVKKLPNFSIACIGAFFTVLITQTSFYKDIQYFLNSTSFDVATPITNADVGYYVFQRPFLMDINNYLITFFVLLGLYTIAYFLISYFSIFKQDIAAVLKAPSFLRQISVIGALLLLSIATTFKFQLDGQVYGDFVGVTGMGYVQDVLWKPFYTVMPFVLIAIVVLAMIFVWRHKFKNAVVTVVIFPVLFILVGILSSIIQGFIVKPNEPGYENKYLKNNMAMTRLAFDFENLKVSDFSKTNPVTPAIIKNNTNTYNNIRIVDYASTLKNDAQLETIRNFYTFLNGDIINYDINGKETPVFITAREINKDNVLGNNPYVGKVFQYTHGYGVVVNPINQITSIGQSKPLLGDLTMNNNGIPSLKVTQPRIYYGENTNDYAIVNPGKNDKIKETDFNGDPTDYSYDGKGGIPLTFFNKVMYAFMYGDFNMFISSNVDDNSMLLLNRNIVKRAQMALPFISIDEDPYIVIDENGGLKWILDGYTSTDLYPYANSFSGVNYIRNSVKVVIDAYDGKVQAYAIDRKDPILKTLMKIYPNVFEEKPLPTFVTKHMRFPEYLFKLQTEAIKKYHLDPKIETDVNAFYQKQDIWDIAKYSKAQGTASSDIEPYYNMIQLPKGIGKTEELILMRPFTPSSVDESRHNMTAWMAARNSIENYGELVLFKFSKSSNVLGPDQIAVNISQIKEISNNMTLWNQKSSRAFMGDLLVVPIEDTILYVQSMYLESDSASSIPQVKTIIVGYQKGNDFVSGIGNTLDIALKDLFNNTNQIVDPGVTPAPTNDPNATPAPSSAPNTQTDKELIAKYKAEIQKRLDEIQALLNKFPQ
ncbi:MAG: UPF0182 family protein [Clostridia bacterium]